MAFLVTVAVAAGSIFDVGLFLSFEGLATRVLIRAWANPGKPVLGVDMDELEVSELADDVEPVLLVELDNFRQVWLAAAAACESTCKTRS